MDTTSDTDADTDPEKTPAGRAILDRPEVRDLSINAGHECAVIFVTFETWSIPSDFAQQYDMRLASATIVDPRPRWKRVFGVGRSAYLEARYVRRYREEAGG
mgnify:CR=1 FL=1